MLTMPPQKNRKKRQIPTLSYGVPIISVKDAVWPTIEEVKEDLWQTVHGAHPKWYTPTMTGN